MAASLTWRIRSYDRNHTFRLLHGRCSRRGAGDGDAVSVQPGDMEVISKTVRRLQLFLAAALGALAVAMWQYMPVAPAAEVEDGAMVAACRLPSQDGEMTVFIVEGGKMKCWRWQ
jgi:hypothetical protein